jgi:hypothetical protein
MDWLVWLGLLILLGMLVSAGSSSSGHSSSAGEERRAASKAAAGAVRHGAVEESFVGGAPGSSPRRMRGRSSRSCWRAPERAAGRRNGRLEVDSAARVPSRLARQDIHSRANHDAGGAATGDYRSGRGQARRPYGMSAPYLRRPRRRAGVTSGRVH